MGDNYSSCEVNFGVSATSDEYIYGEVGISFNCRVEYRYETRDGIDLLSDGSASTVDSLWLTGTYNYVTISLSFRPGSIMSEVVRVRLTDASCISDVM